MKRGLFILITVFISFAAYSQQSEDNSKLYQPYLYGSALINTDFIFDGKQMDPDWTGGFRPSKIPIYPSDPGWGTNGHTYISLRQSTFKLDGGIPTGKKWGDVKVHFSFDLFGLGLHAGETSLRLRLAYGTWGPFLVGKDWSTFITFDAFPNNWDWWGPSGMALLSSTMFRYTHDFNKHHRLEAAFELPGSEIDPGYLREIDPALLNVRTKEILPDFVARYSLLGDWGYIKGALLLRQLSYEILSQEKEKVVEKNKFGWAFNFVSKVRMFKNHGALKLQGVYGYGYAGYNNDGGVEITPDYNFKAVVPLQYGYVLAYDYNINKRWETSIVYSETQQDNSIGQTNDAFHRSQYFVVQLAYHVFQDRFLLGLNYQWGKRFNKNLDAADDYRIMFSARYIVNWKPK